MCILMDIIEQNFRGLVSNQGLEIMKRPVCSELCNGICKEEYLKGDNYGRKDSM